MVSDSFFIDCLYQNYLKLKKVNRIFFDQENISKINIDDILDESFRIIHNVKGNLGFLRLEIEARKVQRLEDRYLHLIKHTPSIDDLYIENIQIEKELKRIVDKHIILKQNNFVSLEELITKIKNEFDHYNKITDKNIKIMTICNGNSLKKELSQDVYQIAYQIIKNATSHGYNDKPMTIRINALLTHNKVKLKISNDGLKINYAKLFKKARENNIKNVNKDNILFIKNLSTKEEHDYLSGCGFGLNYVNEIINKRNGSIKVVSQNDFTCFYITIPL